MVHKQHTLSVKMLLWRSAYAILLNMKRLRSHRGGYTIVETLIYLGVTSILFVSAAILISGQQAKTEYNQAIREVESFILDINNDIATGYYPAASEGCINDGGTPKITGPGDGQGTSGDCLFLGRLLHVVPQGDSPQTINIHTLVGTRLIGNTEEETKTLADARARGFSDKLVETKEFSPILSFKWLRYNGGANDTTVFGFVSDLQPLSSLDGGSAVASTIAENTGSSVGSIPSSAFDLYTAASGVFEENPGQIVLCIESNAFKAYSLVTIDQNTSGGISTVTEHGKECNDI